ncbi:MAG: BON domain-containing protein [Magnetococcales bacterium]|nr:BON domain-containing protein [Magnetococcales bacterium]
MQNWKKVIAGITTAAMLSGCAAMMGGQGATPQQAQPEQSTGNGGISRFKSYMDDGLIATMIRMAYLRSKEIRVANVNVEVSRGRVLLTGSSASSREIEEAIRVAKGVNGVRNVTSELKVQHTSAAELAEDAVISSKVKVKLLADTIVRGLSIEVETTKGVVYLIGMANTVAERDQAVAVASRVGGVREVVSYIEVDVNAQAPAPARMEQIPPQQLAPVIQEGEGEIMQDVGVPADG